MPEHPTSPRYEPPSGEYKNVTIRVISPHDSRVARERALGEIKQRPQMYKWVSFGGVKLVGSSCRGDMSTLDIAFRVYGDSPLETVMHHIDSAARRVGEFQGYIL